MRILALVRSIYESMRRCVKLVIFHVHIQLQPHATRTASKSEDAQLRNTMTLDLQLSIASGPATDACLQVLLLLSALWTLAWWKHRDMLPCIFTQASHDAWRQRTCSVRALTSTMAKTCQLLLATSRYMFFGTTEQRQLGLSLGIELHHNSSA